MLKYFLATHPSLLWQECWGGKGCLELSALLAGTLPEPVSNRFVNTGSGDRFM